MNVFFILFDLRASSSNCFLLVLYLFISSPPHFIYLARRLRSENELIFIQVPEFAFHVYLRKINTDRFYDRISTKTNEP